VELNDPEAIAAIATLHDDYEAALVANDVAALNGYFWNSPHVVRYGVAEQLYGIDELRAYRDGNTPKFTERRIVRRQIATFAGAFATVMSEIEMVIDGTRRRSRQSQTWVQIPSAGWRIVAAHVSAPLSSTVRDSQWRRYADMLAGSLGLTLDEPQRAGVVANLERTAIIAAPMLAVPLPDEVEPAPVFTA